MFDFENNQLFVDAPVAYWVLDAQGQHVAANRKFWELFEFSAEDDVSVELITHSDSQADTQAYLADLISGKRDSVVIPKQYVRADGTAFWGRLTAHRVSVEDGDDLILGVIQDTDGRRKLEVRLREAAKDQSEFVARVSHELRNPVHTIAGLAELLTTTDLDRQSQHHASVILREALSLTSIVSDLLDIGKFDTDSLLVGAAPLLGPLNHRSLGPRSAILGRREKSATGYNGRRCASNLCHWRFWPAHTNPRQSS
jgi:PAS domain S-box-containing protein